MAENNLKHSTKIGLYWKFAEQFSNYGIQFIIGIIMARVLSPSDYGITALPAVFIALASQFVGGGFGDALVRKPELKEEDLSTAFYYSFIVGISFYIVLFLCSPLIAAFYDIPVLTPLMRVTSLSFIFSSLGAPQAILLKRNLNFKTPAKINVTIRVLSGFVGIVLAYSGYGVWALVISNLFSIAFTQITLFLIVKWLPKTKWSSESFRYLWSYGNKMMASYVLDTIYTNITPIIVGKFFGTFELGLYNRAQNYASLPSQNIHGVVREVSFPVLSKIQDDKQRLVDVYRRMINLSTFIVFPLMLLMAAIARPLIITMITAKWESCIVLLQLLCFAKMFHPVFALNLNILMVGGRTDLYLKLEVIKKVLSLIMLCCFLPFGLTAFCASQIIISVFYLIIDTYYTGKLYGYGLLKQLKDISNKLILSVLMGLTVYVVNIFIENMWAQLLAGCAIGACIYLGGAYLFKFSEIEDVKYMLSKKRI